MSSTHSTAKSQEDAHSDSKNKPLSAQKGTDAVPTDIKGILFDNDGTLVDTEELILLSFRYAAETVLGVTPTYEQMMGGVGIPLAGQMHDLTDDSEKAEELVRVYRDHNHTIHDQMVKTFAGIPELLSDLCDAGYKLGVVTSKRHALAQRGLEICGVMHYFDFLVGSDTWHEHKPAPGPVLRGCDLLNLSPKNCMYVGDSPYDIQSGNAAGTSTVAALWGMFPEAVLADENPTYQCESVESLRELLL